MFDTLVRGAHSFHLQLSPLPRGEERAGGKSTVLRGQSTEVATGSERHARPGCPSAISSEDPPTPHATPRPLTTPCHAAPPLRRSLVAPFRPHVLLRNERGTRRSPSDPIRSHSIPFPGDHRTRTRSLVLVSWNSVQFNDSVMYVCYKVLQRFNHIP